jgi:hypothetical protein
LLPAPRASLWPRFPFSDPADAPQAKSQEELDAYLQIRSATEAPEIIKHVDGFASRFPGSAFLDAAYQDQALAYQRLGNFSASVSAGEKSLRANPDNIKTLLALARLSPMVRFSIRTERNCWSKRRTMLTGLCSV